MKKIILIISIFLLIGCTKSNKESYKEELSLLGKYQHNTSSFTEGLFFYDNQLYESSGLYGESKITKNINLDNEDYEKEYKFNETIFAEGATIFKDKLYVLTWKENKVFVFNKDTLTVEKELPYDKEGWGLTTDQEYLIASDGTNKLYYLDESLNTVKTISIDGAYYLNELEYINGYIWANIYMSDRIVVIDPNKKEIIKTISFDGLYKKPEDVNSVLNGIAYNDNKIYITGKNFDTIYVFQIKE